MSKASVIFQSPLARYEEPQISFETKTGLLDDPTNRTTNGPLIEMRLVSKNYIGPNHIEGAAISSCWNDHQRLFPHLACTVQAYLCVPATCVFCERSLCTDTDLITYKRNRKLTFLTENFELIPKS